MRRLKKGTCVRVWSPVFPLPFGLKGTIVDEGPIPNSWDVLMDNDGKTQCWWAGHLQVIT